MTKNTAAFIKPVIINSFVVNSHNTEILIILGLIMSKICTTIPINKTNKRE